MMLTRRAQCTYFGKFSLAELLLAILPSKNIATSQRPELNLGKYITLTSTVHEFRVSRDNLLLTVLCFENVMAK
jgi:hypothetical protein